MAPHPNAILRLRSGAGTQPQGVSVRNVPLRRDFPKVGKRPKTGGTRHARTRLSRTLALPTCDHSPLFTATVTAGALGTNRTYTTHLPWVPLYRGFIFPCAGAQGEQTRQQERKKK